MKHEVTASYLILSSLCVGMPKTLRELSQTVYPNSKCKKNVKHTVKEHLTTFDSIITKAKKPRLTRKGVRILKKLILDFIDGTSGIDKTDRLLGKNQDKVAIFRIRKIPDYMKEEVFKQPEYKFLVEIESQIDLALHVSGHDEREKTLEAVVDRLSSLKGRELLLIDNKFWNEAREIEKKFSVPSNKYAYKVDPEKLFNLFIECNRIPEIIAKKINTIEFKWYLMHWMIKELPRNVSHRTVMKQIHARLASYATDYEMGSFLYHKFGIETAQRKKLHRMLLPVRQEILEHFNKLISEFDKKYEPFNTSKT